jgi:uroporphyrinogen decarboxylase
MNNIIRNLSDIKQNIRKNASLRKKELIAMLSGESKFIPLYYSFVAEDTIILKGKRLLRTLEKYPDDIVTIDPFPAFIGYKTADSKQGSFDLYLDEDKTWVDEWGTKWSHKISSAGTGAIDYPLKSYDYFEQYIQNVIPRGSFPSRFENANKWIKNIYNWDKKYLVGKMILGIFERAQAIRGTENLFMDFYFNKKMVQRLIRELTNYNLAVIEEWSKLNVDCILFTDDWGGQDNLLISPVLWRELFKPYYVELVNCAHRNDIRVIFHSCGAVTKIVGDLIEIGVDVIHPLQASCNDHSYLAKEFGKDLTIMGGLDVQRELPTGNKDQIKRSLYNFVEIFSKYNCGIILSPTNTIVPDTPIENIQFAFETMHKISQESE